MPRIIWSPDLFPQGASRKSVLLKYTLENVDLLEPVHFTDGKTEAPKQPSPTSLAGSTVCIRRQVSNLHPCRLLSPQYGQLFLGGSLPQTGTGTWMGSSRWVLFAEQPVGLWLWLSWNPGPLTDGSDPL